MPSDKPSVDRRNFIQASAGLAAIAAGAAGTAQAQSARPANLSAGASLEVRRVVTGHRDNGDSYVAIDEIPSDVTSRREGMQAVVIWSTGESPADNADPQDGAARTLATSDDNGTVFRIVQYDPGVAPRNHRTQSVDYAVIMSGEITMRLDEGEVVLRQGDVLVQRGTIHDWVNNGTEPCVVAFILCAAKELEVGGRVLEATG
ncbi:MAG: cupin domain-containing protein [Gammaproteobacteria bacterium]